MNLSMRLSNGTIVLFIHAFVYSQSVNNRYSSHIGTGGLVFFFNPTRVLVNETDVVRELVYDMTYNLGLDSLTLNFTVVGKGNIVEPAVKFNSEIDGFELNNVKLLYVEKRKAYYIYRYTSKVLYEDMVSSFRGSLPMKIELVIKDMVITAQYGKRKWKKEVKTMSEIFELIELQKKML